MKAKDTVIPNSTYKPLYERTKTYLNELDLSFPEFYKHNTPHNYYGVPNHADENILINHDADEVELLTIKNRYPDYINIFTAISGNGRSIGAAATLPNDEKILLKLPNWFNLNSCIAALILKIIKYSSTYDMKIIIHTNNLIFTKKIVENMYNNNIFSKIYNLINSSNEKIKLLYSNPSPAISNETAKEAKLACELSFPVAQKVPNIEDYYNLINKKIISGWNKLWE